MIPTYPWPVWAAPPLKLVGRFPLADRGFETTYRGPTHAVHLHGYAGRMRLAGEEVELRPGDLTLSPARLPSAYDLAAPGQHWCVHFHPTESAGPALELPLHLSLGAASAHAADRFAALARLQARAETGQGDDALARAAASVAFQDLLLWCATHARDAGSPGDELADAVAAVIERRFAEPLTAEAIAREVGRSSQHVARVFRRRFGTTIPNFTLQRRMAHARHLLEASDLPVAEVGRRVGIDDPQYFNKLARRFLGESPSAIRRGARSA